MYYDIEREENNMESSNDNQKQKEQDEPIVNSIGGVFAGIVFFIICIFLLNSCNNSENKYEETLNDGLDKFYHGEKMTKEEYEATNEYFNWIDDQKEKTYDNWD